MKKRSVIGYLRVSSAEQRDAGVSLAAQRAKIEQYAALNDYPIQGIYSDEGQSGTRTTRAGLQEALQAACQHKGIFVVYSLSRFSRSTTDTLRFTSQLQKAGAELVSISERIDTLSAAGKMVFRVLAVLNEFEADLGSERTKAALEYRRSKNLKNGGYIPYGYSADKNNLLLPCPSEQPILKAMIKQYEGGKSYTAIAKDLNAAGIPTKLGKRWHSQSVKSIIQRERGLNLEAMQQDGPTVHANQINRL